jgi:hypothetical protein
VDDQVAQVWYWNSDSGAFARLCRQGNYDLGASGALTLTS